MTVASETARYKIISGAGTTGPFTYDFRITAASDLKAVVIDADGVRTAITPASVTGVGDAGGGTITTTNAVAAGEQLLLYADVPITQPIDYIAGDSFPAESHEGALDRLTLVAQDARRDIDRAFKVALGDDAPADTTYDELVDDVAAAVGADAVALVNAAGSTQVGLVNDAGSGQIALINTAGSTQVDAVDAAGAAQLVLIEDEGDEQVARIAATDAGTLFASTANALSNGAVAILAITGGSGGTNGTFDAAISGGGGTGMAIRFVVSGGAVTSATILNPGVNYTSAPTISLAASSGLTGASITVTLGARRSVGQYFTTPGTAGAAINVYRVDSGPTATLIGQLEAWQAKALRFFYGRARHDTAVSGGSRPYVEPYRLRMYQGALAGGAVKNANGTYTLPSNATWTSPQLTAGVFDVAGNRYAYVPTTTETAGAIEIKIARAGTTIAAGNTTTQPSPDYYRQTWNNSAPLPYVQIEIKNVSASSVTIYPIEVYTTDASYFPQVQRFDDTTPVSENRRVIDWNEISPMARWARRDSALWAADETRITAAFDSVSGSDAAAGLPWTPKQNLTAGSALSAGAVLGLRNGSVWNQDVNTLIGSTTQGLRVRGYRGGRPFSPFPILDSGVDVTGLTWTDEGDNTWSATVPCSATMIKSGELNYSYVSVVEIELSREADEPLGCQYILEPVNVVVTGAPPVPAASQATAIAKVKAVAGRTLGVYTPGATSYTLYIHTRDGLSPSAGTTYGYRATNRRLGMDWVQGNTRTAVVQNLEFRQGADGLGIVNGSDQSAFDGVIASNGYKHTIHIEAGECRNFLVYNRGARSGVDTAANAANCYVSPSANNLSWRWTNGLCIDCHTSIYSHCAAGKYDRGEISYCWVVRDRDPVTGNLGLGDSLASDQVYVTEEKWNYIKGYISTGRAGTEVNVTEGHFHHNLVRECGRFVSRTLTEHNIVQVENISDPNNAAQRNSRGCQLKQDHVVRNNLIHITTTTNALADYSTQAVEVVPSGNDNPDFSRNIVVMENTLGTSSAFVTEAASGLTWTSDYNVVVMCVPGAFSTTKFGTGSKTTVADYLTFFPGHDANTLFVDLRDDPRGARAIFMDPANGDYRWAQTEVAARVKAYCVANNVGPDWILKEWPEIPTIDEAREMMIASV